MIDVSTSGVAVSADVYPDIGTPLAVGASVGRVIRHFREGFAVKFVELLDSGSLERLVTRPALQRQHEKLTNGVSRLGAALAKNQSAPGPGASLHAARL